METVLCRQSNVQRLSTVREHGLSSFWDSDLLSPNHLSCGGLRVVL